MKKTILNVKRFFSCKLRHYLDRSETNYRGTDNGQYSNYWQNSPAHADSLGWAFHIFSCLFQSRMIDYGGERLILKRIRNITFLFWELIRPKVPFPLDLCYSIRFPTDKIVHYFPLDLTKLCIQVNRGRKETRKLSKTQSSIS